MCYNWVTPIKSRRKHFWKSTLQSGLTLGDWEKLQPAGSLQTGQGYAWNFGWSCTVVPLAAAWHLFRKWKENIYLWISTWSSTLWLYAFHVIMCNRYAFPYFAPWRCQGSWPAWSAAAPVHLPLAHRYPGCPSVLWKHTHKEVHSQCKTLTGQHTF